MGVLSRLSGLPGLRRLFVKTQPPPPQLRKGPEQEDLFAELLREANIYNYYMTRMDLPQDRMSRYKRYVQMDLNEIIAKYLNILADDCAQRDPTTNEVIRVESENDDTSSILMELIKRLQLSNDAWSIIRQLALLGDGFQRLHRKPDDSGIAALHMELPHMMWRVEDQYRNLMGFLKQEADPMSTQTKKVLEPKLSLPWDYVHYRLPNSDPSNFYGESLLRTVFRAYNRLLMMEDRASVDRLARRVDRLCFYVDVGAASPEDSLRVVERWRKQLKKRRDFAVDESVYKQEINPMDSGEDIFWPIREGKLSKVDRLPGSGAVPDVYDLEYFLERFFCGLGVPKAFFGFEGGSPVDMKTPLAHQDIQFARTCRRVQYAFLETVALICQIHLELTGVDTSQASAQFTLIMSPVSHLDETQRRELMELRMDLMARLMELGMSLAIQDKEWLTYVLKDVGGLPPDLVASVVEQPHQGAGLQGAEPLQASEKKALREAYEKSVRSQQVVKRIVNPGCFCSQWLRHMDPPSKELVEKREKILAEQKKEQEEVE